MELPLLRGNGERRPWSRRFEASREKPTRGFVVRGGGGGGEAERDGGGLEENGGDPQSLYDGGFMLIRTGIYIYLFV